MVQIKFVGLFEMNNFTFEHFFLSRIVWPENGFFCFVKTIFSGSEGLKTWTFDKNGGGGHFLHKSNTFSDENVKN